MRILVAIPAYNEQQTVGQVAQRVREALPQCELLIVDDGSTDATPEILRELGIATARHPCNLGYGRAIQTAIKFALAGGHDALLTLDADGQHDPTQLPALLEAFERASWDLCVGSRYVKSRSYAGVPLGRRIGMWTFSRVLALLTGRRIYDTTSGLKLFRRSVFTPLTLWHFVDFHAEALAYLLRLGFDVAEYPIVVSARGHGQSMYSFFSSLQYPSKTLLMLLLGLVQAEMARRRMA